MSKKDSTLTQADLRSLLRYDPATGIFTWARSRTNRVKVGDIAGSKNAHGYVSINLSGRREYAHRIAWMYIYGYWPTTIDHKDGDTSNNALENLRDVSMQENLQNIRSAKRHNKSSGVLGVTKRGNRWLAQIVVENKTTYIGTYNTKEEAHQAYLAEKCKVHPGQLIGLQAPAAFSRTP